MRQRTPSRIARSFLACSALLAMMFGFATRAIAQPRPQDASSKPSPASSATSTAPVSGPEVCKTCHEAEYNSWEKSPHWKTTLDKKGDPVHQGCQGCHGSATEHLADPTNTSKLLLFEKAAPKEVTDRCLTCHAGGNEHMNALNSIHTQNGVSCISCHSPHHSGGKEFLLTKSQPELCYSCHLAKKAEFAMPFHHRVNEGLVQCSDCHNVHGTAGPKQVRASASQDAVCFKCHTDKQGPFVYEHLTVKVDGCTSCHSVHGGPNAHMLKVSNVNLLCLQCHTTSTFSGAPGAPSFHNQASFFQACTLCHVAIHGSNFSSTFFK
jgi:DmsE family decaheme c-type cytochrome